MARNTGRVSPLSTGRGLRRQSRPAEGGVYVQATEAGRGRKGPLDRRTPGDDRDLGGVQRRQRGGTTGKGTSVTGSREELLVATQQVREPRTRGGGRRVEEPSRWMVDPRPGELGGRSVCKEISKQRQKVKDEGAIRVQSRGGERRS